MKHKYFSLLLALLMSMEASVTFAHDFEVDGIYYNITSSEEATVAVTYKGDFPISYSGEYTGNVVISETVAYDGKTYNVTSIGESAFAYCYGLTSITIGNNVTSIARLAFFGCSGLTSITIPQSVTSMGNFAFSGCSALTSISIPDSVTTISDFVFSGCSDLASVTIPESVTEIRWSAFQGCSGLTSITIPEGVTSIGYSAFSGCSSLTSVTIPSSVIEIGYATFGGCNNLISIVVDSDNTVYDSRGNCNAIVETATNTLVQGCKNTTIPDSVTAIGNYAFYACDSLTSITIPSSITSIGNYAFSACSGLESIVVENWNPIYDSRNSCNAIIETSSNTLIFGCKTTVIPESVSEIGSSSFYGCTGLTSITIPGSVTTIGSSAFSGCTGLKEIYCLSEEVPEVGDDTFYGMDVSNVMLIVPEDAVEKYKAHPVWGQFLIRTTTGIRSLGTEGRNVRSVYDLNGRRQNTEQRGLYIVRMSDGTVKKVMVK